MRFLLSILSIIASATTVSAATSFVIDYEEFGIEPTYGEPVEMCSTKGNVDYCEENLYVYGWHLPWKLLSDYDWQDSTVYRARPGFVFDPVDFEIYSAYSFLARIDCTGFQPTDFGDTCDGSGGDEREWALEHYDDFKRYESPYLEISGYRDGMLTAFSSLNPNGLKEYRFGSGFAGLDMLKIDLVGSKISTGGTNYDATFEDGYLYACPSFGGLASECNHLEYDNFRMVSYRIGKSPIPAPVPLPAGGSMLLFGLVGFFGFRRLISISKSSV